MALYIVATPLGNLGDITIRAKEVLSSATLILAEDTRTTKKLFSLLDIDYSNKTFLSSHSHSTKASLQKTLLECKDHATIALVTDAGTPAISDPGSYFIAHFQEMYPEEIVYPVPGPSAVIAALSVSGFPTSHFEFLGFIPHKKGRQTLFKSFQEKAHTIAFYESPHRILKTLESLHEAIAERPIFIAREMTKQYEEYKHGNSIELLKYFKTNSDKVRGEFVVVISPLP